MIRPYSEFPRRATPLEEFLTSEDDIVPYVLSYLEIPDVFMLGTLNYRLRHWFSRYRQKTWDFERFARNYVRYPIELFKLCDPRHTLIYGEAVLRFMLRSQPGDTPLEICTDLNNIDAIVHGLCDNNYHCPLLELHSDEIGRRDRIADLVRRTHRLDSMTWYLRADKASCNIDLQGFLFQFNRGIGSSFRTVNVHLIRCEPLRHVLSRIMSQYYSNQIFRRNFPHT